MFALGEVQWNPRSYASQCPRRSLECACLCWQLMPFWMPCVPWPPCSAEHWADSVQAGRAWPGYDSPKKTPRGCLTTPELAGAPPAKFRPFQYSARLCRGRPCHCRWFGATPTLFGALSHPGPGCNAARQQDNRFSKVSSVWVESQIPGAKLQLVPLGSNRQQALTDRNASPVQCLDSLKNLTILYVHADVGSSL